MQNTTNGMASFIEQKQQIIEFLNVDSIQAGALSENRSNIQFNQIYYSQRDYDYSKTSDPQMIKRLLDRIGRFVYDSTSAYIWSSATGTGKTTFAVKCAVELVRKHCHYNEAHTAYTYHSIFFISASEYVSAMLDTSIAGRERFYELENKMINANLLIIDDIGTFNMSETQRIRFLSILDRRKNQLHCRGNIFTSNISPNEINKFIGDRVASRVFDNTKIIEFGNIDCRSSLSLTNENDCVF